MLRFCFVLCLAILAAGAATPAPRVSFEDPRPISVNLQHLPGAPWGREYTLGAQVALAFDSLDRPHITYVETHNAYSLKYARWTGTAWSITPLYDGASYLKEATTSLVVDAAGDVHIGVTGNQYVARKSGTWQREFVGEISGTPSIRVGSDGQPRMAYIQRTGSNLLLRYAVRSSSGSWSVETVRTLPLLDGVITSVETHGWCSLALSTTDVPNISFYDTEFRSIRYAYKSGSSWIFITVDSSSADAGSRNAIAMDSSNRRYIAYFDRAASRVKIAFQTASGWVFETVSPALSFFSWYGLPNVSVAVAPNGTIAVGYSSGDGASIHRRIGGVWHRTDIAPDLYTPIHQLALAFDSASRLGVAYAGNVPGRSGCLSYYTITGSGSGVVVSQVVDSPGQMGSTVVAMSRDGMGVLYNNASMQSLLLYVSGFVFLPPGGMTFGDDACVTRGPFQDLHADVDGAEYAGSWYASVYEDRPGARRLLLAQKTWPGIHNPYYSWPYEVVDQSADVGQYNSIVAETGGTLHISYFDATNGDLKYARRTGSGWTINVVDSAGIVGYDTSLALNTGGEPRISYWDVTNRDLKFASRVSALGTWALYVVDSAGDVGEYSSLAYDSSNRPHISYYDRTNRALKYARGPAGSWSIVTVDSGNVGEFTSLALDSAGNPHIVYYDRGQGDLKYAWFNGTGWDIRRLDSAGDVGQRACIGIRGSHIKIAYYDATLGGVKEIWGYVDYTGPSSVTVTDEGDFTTDSTRLSASWTAAEDAESGIRHYRYAIGTSPSDPGSGYVVPWKTVSGGTRSMTETGLSLQNGTVYYIYVQARNHAGEWGPVGVSDGIRAVNGATRIAEAKMLPDGTWVRLTGKVASRDASFYFFYIQEPDRSSGILVSSLSGSLPAIDLEKGKLVNVTGVMGRLSGGQRRVLEPVVEITGTAAPPRPLLLRNNEVVGTDFFLVPGPGGSGQAGAPGRRGLNNVGLYVRTTGRVVSHPDSTSFIIDDGSLPGGLRVTHESTWTRPPVGALAEVYGYPSLSFGEGVLYLEGSGKWRLLE